VLAPDITGPDYVATTIGDGNELGAALPSRQIQADANKQPSIVGQN
jgi:hypothetical protein